MIDIASQPIIVVDVVMLGASAGGRNYPIQIDTDTRYMPHLAVDDRDNRPQVADRVTPYINIKRGDWVTAVVIWQRT